MSIKPLSTRKKAFALVPLVLACGAWTASIAGVGSNASADAADVTSTHTLPGGVTVPTKAIEAPASVPIPGTIAPAVPDGAANAVVSGASASGIPTIALAAYQRASQVMNSADKTCNIPWELIAAIGRVESDNGQTQDNHLTNSGTDVPGIFGPVLNGQNGTQAVPDTDGGRLDHNKVWDRAVGPMQFIPSTWKVVQVDADGDGKRNPQDINDASLATAVYLCSGDQNLANRAGQQSAVFRYNHSQSYVDLVLRIMEAYSQGDYTAVPSSSFGGSILAPSYSSAISQRRESYKVRQFKFRHSGSGSAGGSSGSGASGTGSTGTGGSTGAPAGGSGGGGGALGGSPTPLPTPIPTPVQKVLDAAQALSLCNSQLGALDPTGQLAKLGASACQGAVTGMTQAKALATIPNTLAAAVTWLQGLGVTGLGGLGGLGGL